MENKNQNIKDIIGFRIRLLRERAGYTQSSLSRFLGVSKSAVSQWEGGLRKPDAETLKDIADIFDTSSDFLLGRSDNPGITPPLQHKKISYDSWVRLPVLNEIRDRKPLFSEENIVDWKHVPLAEIQSGEHFFLKVTDLEMATDHIIPGSEVLVRRQDTVKSGEIAIVKVKNENARISRVKFSKKYIILYSSFKNNEPMMYKIEEVRIFGKIVKIEISLK